MGILLERGEDVPAKEAAREHVGVGEPPPVRPAGRAVGVGVVEPLQEERDPAQLVLDRADPQAGKPLEHAGEDQFGERLADLEVRVDEHRGRHVLHVEPEGVGADAGVGALGGDVERQRHLQVLGGGPEPVVLRRPVRLPRWRGDRDQRPAEAHPTASLQLGGGVVDVVDVDHRHALEAARVLGAELGQPVVVGLHRDGDDVADRHPEQHQPLARVQDRTPHAVELVLREVPARILDRRAHLGEGPGGPQVVRVLLEAVTGLDPEERHRLVAVDVPPVAVVAGHHLGQPVLETAPPAGPEVGGLDDVGVGRDQPGAAEYLGRGR